MEINVDYRVKGLNTNLLAQVKKQVIAKVESIVIGVIEDYIKELESHIGTIPGAAGYRDEDVNWAPLVLSKDKKAGNFWYETGETARAIIVNIRASNTGVKVFAGIPSTAGAFEKALWNELGFTPQGGDHLIRRPLFLPLAEEHSEEIRRRVTQYVKTTRLKVSVPI